MIGHWRGAVHVMRGMLICRCCGMHLLPLPPVAVPSLFGLHLNPLACSLQSVFQLPSRKADKDKPRNIDKMLDMLKR